MSALACCTNRSRSVEQHYCVRTLCHHCSYRGGFRLDLLLSDELNIKEWFEGMFWLSVIGKESSLRSAGLLSNGNQSMASGTVRRLTYKKVLLIQTKMLM